MINQEIDQEIDKKETKDSTNWKAWYVGLVAFLVVQIVAYLWISNLYAA